MLNNNVNEILVVGINTELTFFKIDSDLFTNPVTKNLINKEEIENLINNYKDFGYNVFMIASEEATQEPSLSIEYYDLNLDMTIEEVLQVSYTVIATKEGEEKSFSRCKEGWSVLGQNKIITNLKEEIEYLVQKGFCFGFYDKDWQIV